MLLYHQKLSLIAIAPELGPKGHKVWDILRAMMVEAWRAKREFVTPKNQTLADMAGCHLRTVQRAIHALERAGILRITERFIVVGKQAIQLSNRLSVVMADLKARVMAAKPAKHDKVVTPITDFLYSDRFKPSETYQLLMKTGLRHNLC